MHSLPADLQKAIANGICKINIDTNLRRSFAEALRDILAKDQAVYDTREIMASGRVAVQKVVESRIKIFGSAGKF